MASGATCGKVELRMGKTRITGVGGMADILGAPASSAGDDFHELWALRKVLQLLDPGSHLRSVVVEGVPDDERAAELGAGAQAVDVTEVSAGPGGDSWVLEQLKYSTANPDSPWTWTRLTAERNARRTDSSVIGKLAGAFAGVSGARTVRIVTNQPLAPKVAEDLGAWPALLRDGKAEPDADFARLRSALGLADGDLAVFLESFDISGFGSFTRLELETQLLMELGRLTDADARNDLDVLQQRIAAYILPENRGRPPIDRETLLSWLGVGVEDVLFPAPSELVPAAPYVRRNVTPAVVQAILETGDRIVRIHSEGGCGKTSLVCALPSELPAGSECVLYDCYGGGLYLTADKRRHHPNQAFVQVSNEVAGRIGSPFVMRRTNSVDVTASFQRRLQAAAKLVRARDAKALLVIVFDAIDNARIAAEKRKEPCFLDELTSLSGWPENVRLVVTGRSGRLRSLGGPEVFHDVKIPNFDIEETTALVGQERPGWSPEVVRDLHELSGGVPRRIAYALEGAHEDGQALAIGRLTPKQPGLDQLFVQRREEAAIRLGDAAAVDRLLCALVHMPRPTPAHALAWVAELDEPHIADLATDLGGLTLRDEGWSFSDEDFEAFAQELTQDISAPLIERAADLLLQKRDTDVYAARSVAEILVQAGRLQALYDLVLSAETPACISDVAERHALQARRMGLAVNCARQAKASADANRLLVAAATGMKTDALVRKLLLSNIDLAAVLSPAEAFRVAMTEASGRASRGRLRLAMARRKMVEAPQTARDHMRWWAAWVEDRNGASPKKRDKITSQDLAVEFEVTEALQDLETAVVRLRRWGPRSAVLMVIEQICLRAGAAGRGADLEAFLGRRRLPARVALSVADGLLRSGRPFSLDVGGVVVQVIGRMTSRDPFSDAPKARRLLDLLEAAAEVAPAAAVRSALDRHFPQRAMPVDRLSVARGAVDILARALSLRRQLTAAPHDLSAWVPEPLPVPPAPAPAPAPGSRRLRGRRPPAAQEETDASKQAQDVNARRRKLLERLTSVVELTDLISDEAVQPDAVTTALVHAVARSRQASDRDVAEIYLQLAKSWMLRLARRGALTAAALSRLRPETSRAYLNWLEALSGICGTASLVLEPLVEIAKEVETASGGASNRAAGLMSCARIAIGFDPDLARDFFQRALALTERVDAEVLAQLKATCAVAAAGVGGSREARRDLAEALADVTGAIQATLGDEVDGYLPWDDVISACAAIDPPTSLAAVGRWRDVGLIQPQAGLEALAAADLPDSLARLLAALTNDYKLAPKTADEAEAMARAALVGGDGDAVRQACEQMQGLDRGLVEGQWSQQLRDTDTFLDTLEEKDAEATVKPPAVRSLDPIATLADLDAILGNGPSGRTYPPPLAELLDRVRDPSLRVPILRRLVEVMPRGDQLAQFLVELLPNWIAYPQ
jgi:hypothetical protein